MNPERPDTAADTNHPNITAPAREKRRRLIQAGVAGAPVLLALKSTSALATDCKLPSGFSVSGNLSQTGSANCATPFPSISSCKTKLQNNPSLNVKFNTVFTAGPKPGLGINASSFKLLDALNRGDIHATAVASYLGAADLYAPLIPQIQNVWNLAVIGGSTTIGGATWTETEAAKYYNYLLNLN